MPITTDSILRLRLRGRIILGVLIAVIILGLNHWQYYQPKGKELESWKQQNQRVTADLNEIKEAAAQIPEKKKELVQLKKELTRAQTILPEKKEIPALLASVSGLGREFGLEFLTFKPLKETLKDFYAEVPVQIVVFGEFTNVVSFFDKVSKLPRIVNISRTHMKSQLKDSKIKVETAALLTTYRFLTEAEVKIVAARKKAEEAKKRRRRRGR